MRRHKSLIKLSREHHKGLLLAQLLKKDAPAYRGLPTDLQGKIEYAQKEWRTRILPHFDSEDNILFPLVINHDESIDMLIAEIKQEHIELKVLFAAISEEPNAKELLNKIGQMLESHIRKEERLLFQKLQSVIDDEKLDIIEKKLNSTISQGGLSC
jgi:hemerythrin-like domain-containing protein